MAIIIVSDLHIDTWDNGEKTQGKTKARHFLDFLEAKTPEIEALYIAGDLMDMPPVRNHDVVPKGSVAEQVMSGLVAFASKPDKDLVYLVGNHDIGISGLRINLDFQVPWLGRMAITYPRVYIETPAGGVLVEHGHFYDPSLMLFAGDLILGTYYGDVRGLPASDVSSGVIRALQRRDPVTAERVVEAGAMEPVAKQRPGCRSIGRNMINSVQHWFGSTVDVVSPELWRKAAPTALAEYNDSADADHQANTIIFGHTHTPDSMTWDDMQYFNSGSWSSNGPQSTYLEISADGRISSHEWIESLQIQ
ncbi:MAG: metallophosphoesterase [Actinomycetota bacterium]